MLQIGGALTPVSMLVRHMTENWKSVHPGVDVCKESMDWIKVRSNVTSMGEFEELLVNTSNQWLSGALNFKPSDYPASDINVIRVRSVNDTGLYYGKAGNGGMLYTRWQDGKKAWFEVLLINSAVVGIEMVMGAAVILGVVLSALLGDLWAVILFVAFALHWFASWLVSFNPLVIANTALSIQPDSTTTFAVFQREAGGAVIFKGPQDEMERWARTKWIFDNSAKNRVVHWMWVITGSVAALASVTCMVNMTGYCQLGFLAMLGYASIAEIALTVLSRHLQLKSRRFDKTVKVMGEVGKMGKMGKMGKRGNDKWYKSIIQATIGIDKDHRLDEMKWLEYRLTPSRQPFKGMFEAMEYLNGNEKVVGVLEEAMKRFEGVCVGLSDKDKKLAEGMREEMRRVWEKRMQGPVGGQGGGQGNKV
jgi:hypothetical protein